MWQDMNTDLLDAEPDVDMTNLLDLMMLIAAVMMICIPSFSTLSTHLAEVKGGHNEGNLSSCARVSFSKSEQIKWNGSSVTWTELKEKVKVYRDEKNNPEILLIGDKSASYGFSQRLRVLISRYGGKVKELARYKEAE